MPLHGNNLQLNAYRVYDYFSKNVDPATSKLDVPDLTKLIDKKQKMLNVIDSMYEETFIARYDDFDDHMIETISTYKNTNDETILYEKSKYFVFETGEYYVKTKEGNLRNWIYECEMDTIHKSFTKKIKTLEQALKKKQR
jgi:hypothetical protein